MKQYFTSGGGKVRSDGVRRKPIQHLAKYRMLDVLPRKSLWNFTTPRPRPGNWAKKTAGKVLAKYRQPGNGGLIFN